MMRSVIHIGAADGEIDFYEEVGCKNLIYVEPDKASLVILNENVSKHLGRDDKNLQAIKVIPKACSSQGGLKLKFYEWSRSVSLQRPGNRTKEILILGKADPNFHEYEVETTTLMDIHHECFEKSSLIDYLCIDTQGHEKDIICTASCKFLHETFSIIDIELMTDTEQYDVHENNWKEVASHLINSGFIPLIHPNGFTESYIFLNSKHKKWIDNIAKPVAESIARKLMKELFCPRNDGLADHQYLSIGCMGDWHFLPLGITGGSVHTSHLQKFREEFIRRISLITPTQYELITA